MVFGAEEFGDDSGDKGFGLLPVQTVARVAAYLRNSFMKINSSDATVVGRLHETFSYQL